MPVTVAMSCGLSTLRRMIISGREMVATEIITASIV